MGGIGRSYANIPLFQVLFFNASKRVKNWSFCVGVKRNCVEAMFAFLGKWNLDNNIFYFLLKKFHLL